MRLLISCVIVVRIALITASVLCILHVVRELTFNLKLWNLHAYFCVISLLIIRVHIQVAHDPLVTIHS